MLSKVSHTFGVKSSKSSVQYLSYARLGLVRKWDFQVELGLGSEGSVTSMLDPVGPIWTHLYSFGPIFKHFESYCPILIFFKPILPISINF